MGTWHTGDLRYVNDPLVEEFRLWMERIKVRPPVFFTCRLCESRFGTSDELRYHCFEAHPVHEPVLRIEDKELGRLPRIIRERICPDDVMVEFARQAWLNEKECSPEHLPDLLCRSQQGVQLIELEQAGMRRRFKVDFRVALASDLEGVEREFTAFLDDGKLGIESVDSYIRRVHQFRSAADYTDGLCHYLYGVMAKESHPDSSRSREEFVACFNKSLDKLSSYQRPLADLVSGITLFSLNRFSEAANMARGTRLGAVASRFAGWLDGVSDSTLEPFEANFDQLLSDRYIEKIVDWGRRFDTSSPSELEEWEAEGLALRLVGYDEAKFRLLMGEAWSAAQVPSRAAIHAAGIRGGGPFRAWSKRITTDSRRT